MQAVTIVQRENNRFSAISVLVNNRSFMVINVYMPTDKGENLPLFTECLGEMYAMTENSDIESVFVLGDFNAHPGESFCNELLQFCSEHELMFADMGSRGFQSGTFTYTSDAHGCRRWLEHCIVTRSAGLIIESARVSYYSYWSDHFPLIVKCNVT